MTTNLESMLRTYVEGFDGKPVAYGLDDCAPFAGKWVEMATGRVLAIPRYDSREGGQELIRKAGGLVDLCDSLMFDAGFGERYDDPQLGDVGILRTHAFGDVGGIFAHAGIFLWRHAEGVGVVVPRPRYIQKVWAIA
nr:hypothetical protein 11 [Chromatiales bacterium]BDD46442.1 hypothetical protein 12 [bacterium]